MLAFSGFLVASLEVSSWETRVDLDRIRRMFFWRGLLGIDSGRFESYLPNSLFI
jgi:hypothetical protein